MRDIAERSYKTGYIFTHSSLVNQKVNSVNLNIYATIHSLEVATVDNTLENPECFGTFEHDVHALRICNVISECYQKYLQLINERYLKRKKNEGISC